MAYSTKEILSNKTLSDKKAMSTSSLIDKVTEMIFNNQLDDAKNLLLNLSFVNCTMELLDLDNPNSFIVN